MPRVAPQEVIVAGEPTHLVANFGADGMHLFVNGAEVASDGYTGGLLGNFEQLVIGAESGNSTPSTVDSLVSFFDGTLDEFAVYDRALNGGEIQQLFDSGDLGRILVGTAAADEIIGGSDREDLRGGGGEDLLAGRGGDDTLRGGGGDDDLRGGAGNDKLFGGRGADSMFGGSRRRHVSQPSVARTACSAALERICSRAMAGRIRWPAAPMPIPCSAARRSTI